MKAIAILFFSLYCLSIQSQNSSETDQYYYPTGTSWVEATTNTMDESYCDINQYWVGNDTIINEVVYKKVYRNGDLNFYALREYNGRTFLYLYSSEKEVIAYDFTWEIGKKLYIQRTSPPYEFSYFCTITNINQIQLSDKLYYDYINYGEDKIIKGIGSEKGVFYYMFVIPTNGNQQHLLCFSRNGVLIYENPNFVDCESCERRGTKIKVKETNSLFKYANNRFIFFSEKWKNILVSIYDTKGIKIFSKTIGGNDSLDLDFLTNGIYFYRITSDDDSYSGNLIIY